MQANFGQIAHVQKSLDNCLQYCTLAFGFIEAPIEKRNIIDLQRGQNRNHLVQFSNMCHLIKTHQVDNTKNIYFTIYVQPARNLFMFTILLH